MQQGVARTTEPASTLSIQPALLLLEKTPILLETMLRDFAGRSLAVEACTPERWIRYARKCSSHLADIGWNGVRR